MKRFLKKYNTETNVQDALDEGTYNKPYVAYIISGDVIDWNSKSVTPPPTPVIKSITANYTYFDLNYTGSSNTKIYAKFRPIRASYDDGNTIIVGKGYCNCPEQFSINCYFDYDEMDDDYSSDYFTVRYYCGQSEWGEDCFDDDFINDVPTGEIYKAELSNSEVWFKNEDETISRDEMIEGEYEGGPIWLNLTSDEPQYERIGKGVIEYYNVKIYENDVLVMDLVPAESQEYSGKGALYDTINDTYYEANNPSVVSINYY